MEKCLTMGGGQTPVQVRAGRTALLWRWHALLLALACTAGGCGCSGSGLAATWCWLGGVPARLLDACVQLTSMCLTDYSTPWANECPAPSTLALPSLPPHPTPKQKYWHKLLGLIAVMAQDSGPAGDAAWETALQGSLQACACSGCLC